MKPARLACVLPALLDTVALLAACATPGTGPASVGLPALRAGDAWAYNRLNGYNGELEAVVKYEVAEVKGGTVQVRVFKNGKLAGSRTYASGWNPLRGKLPDGTRVGFEPPYPAFPFPLVLGKSWKQSIVALAPAAGKRTRITVYGWVRGWERVKVPAGEFDALKVRRQAYLDDADWWRTATEIEETAWYAPGVGRFIKHEERSHYRELTHGRIPFVIRGDYTVDELVSFSRGS